MVAPHAMAEVDVRFKTMAARDAVWQRITAILETAYVPGTATGIVESRRFLPLNQSPDTRAIFAFSTRPAAAFGLPLDGQPSDGAADSGLTAQSASPPSS